MREMLVGLHLGVVGKALLPGGARLGQDVDLLPAGSAGLGSAHRLEIARQRRLGDGETMRYEHLLQLALRVDAGRADDPLDQAAPRGPCTGRDINILLR